MARRTVQPLKMFVKSVPKCATRGRQYRKTIGRIGTSYVMCVSNLKAIGQTVLKISSGNETAETKKQTKNGDVGHSPTLGEWISK